MAPEQGLRGECQPRSDLYALGIVCMKCSPALPFEADTPLAILLKPQRALPPRRLLNADLPARWKACF